MGIKDLWSILTPFCERKPLYELQNKKVAVDLSGWICQAQCITEYHIQPRMYLRNLYFRTCYLLLQDVYPVFVLEGKAPTLKYKTIANRNELQFKGAKPREEGQKAGGGKGRSRFDFTLKQCEEMLNYMGLVCVTGHGEAEAMCAYLNEEKKVDGCISQDSDCFAYGARVVYRNFSISASGGSVDVYDIQEAKKNLDFGRGKIIALALLCGSDYNEGVFGVGKDSALKLFATVSDEEILQELRAWRTETPKALEERYLRKHICSACSQSCRESRKCVCGKLNSKTQNADLKLATAIRKKSLQDPSFPNEELIDEFLVRKDSVRALDVEWKAPNIQRFLKFTNKFLQWEEVYSFEKFLPVLTRWSILSKNNARPLIQPDYIKKLRNIKGMVGYEIIWKCEDILRLIPEAQLSGVDQLKLCSTIEPLDVINQKFPDLVAAYENSKTKKKPKKTKKVNSAKNTMHKYLLKEKEASDLDSSCFGDEDNEYDLSLIVDDVMSRDRPAAVTEKLRELLDSDLNTSNFFMSAPSEVDMFEMSFNLQTNVDSESSDDDSFDEVYIPLAQRLLKRKNV